MEKLYLPVVFALALISGSAGYSAIVWTNTAGGNWSDAANWNPNQVSASSDVPAVPVHQARQRWQPWTFKLLLEMDNAPSHHGVGVRISVVSMSVLIILCVWGEHPIVFRV